MLHEKLLRNGRPVSGRIAPTIEDVAALAAFAARVTLRLGGRGAVVDDVNLTEVVVADHDLVERGIVIDCIAMGPIEGAFAGTAFAAALAARPEIDVDEFRMFGHVTEICPGSYRRPGPDGPTYAIPRRPRRWSCPWV